MWDIFTGSKITKLWYIDTFLIFFGETVHFGIPRCPIRDSFLDVTGSICKSFSSLGNLEGEDSENSILLVIWMVFNFRRRTAILTHENVRGFVSQLISDEACKAGYNHVQAKCHPRDVGIPVGRPRKYFGFKKSNDHLVFSKYIYVYFYLWKPLIIYIYMYCRKQNLILLSVHQGVWDLYSRCNKSMLETL